MVNKTEKKHKVLSVLEFQAWLEGIEECQPKGWLPDAKQWKVIRNKIKSIDATAMVTAVVQEATPDLGSPRQARPNTVGVPATPRQPMRSPVIPPAPLSPGGIPEGLLPPQAGSGMMTPAAQAALSGRLPSSGPINIPPGSAVAPPSFV